MFEFNGDLAMALRLNNGSNDFGVTVTTDPADWATIATTVPDQKSSTTPVLY